jgi:glutamate dehydrogenase
MHVQPAGQRGTKRRKRADRRRRGLVGEMRRRGRRKSLPALLFGRVAHEDLVNYTAEEIAALDAREPGHLWPSASPALRKSAAIRRTLPRANALKSVSVIEIVNDDMPFLVDSVMGELTERGLDVRLVAHPILARRARRCGAAP